MWDLHVFNPIFFETTVIQLTKFLIYSIDRCTDFIGRTVSWLTSIMVAMVVIVVATRYILQIGSIALQESVTYLHSVVFLLGIGYTLKHGGHVRVDIFYRQFSAVQKSQFLRIKAVEGLGTI